MEGVVPLRRNRKKSVQGYFIPVRFFRALKCQILGFSFEWLVFRIVPVVDRYFLKNAQTYTPILLLFWNQFFLLALAACGFSQFRE